MRPCRRRSGDGTPLCCGPRYAQNQVSDLETTVRSDEEILALEVAVDAFASMKVGKGTSNVGCKGKSETPWQWLGVVVNILTEVAYGLK
jgi:hypothetical protein